MSSKKIVIAGFSGHGLVVAEAAIESNLELKYYFDKKQVTTNPFGLEYLGFENDLNSPFWERNYDYILGVGDNFIRRKTFHFLVSKEVNILNIAHPSSSISAKIELGRGNFISRNASINPMAKIGDFCILNTGCIIEHECIIESGSHIAPGAVLAGNVRIGENSFIGANSVIKQGVRIGKNVIIGAGTVVLNNIPDNCKVVGNPGKIIEKIK